MFLEPDELAQMERAKLHGYRFVGLLFWNPKTDKPGFIRAKIEQDLIEKVEAFLGTICSLAPEG